MSVDAQRYVVNAVEVSLRQVYLTIPSNEKISFSVTTSKVIYGVCVNAIIRNRLTNLFRGEGTKHQDGYYPN